LRIRLTNGRGGDGVSKREKPIPSIFWGAEEGTGKRHAEKLGTFLLRGLTKNGERGGFVGEYLRGRLCVKRNSLHWKTGEKGEEKKESKSGKGQRAVLTLRRKKKAWRGRDSAALRCGEKKTKVESPQTEIFTSDVKSRVNLHQSWIS